jgi:hypothetical protein
METKCEYCERAVAWDETELLRGKRVCRDAKACQSAEDQAHNNYIASLRKRRREGDELTDSETMELAEG